LDNKVGRSRRECRRMADERDHRKVPKGRNFYNPQRKLGVVTALKITAALKGQGNKTQLRFPY